MRAYCLMRASSSLVFSSVRALSPLDSTLSLTTGSVSDMRTLKRYAPMSMLTPSVWSTLKALSL